MGKLQYTNAKILDAKPRKEDTRRYRNILANSGKVMESGESRNLDNLYVMSRGDGLIKISALATNPDKQSEQYKVSLATNHGHYDPVTGERVVEVEDIIGDARVWLEDDGLHARIYFANDDDKADHAWAVSDNASYSIGTEWYEDGYFGAGEEVEGEVGILREISMVDTGNDPRAVTIDTNQSKGDVRAAEDGVKQDNKNKKGNAMSKLLDGLTPEERDQMGHELAEVLNKYTASDEDDAKETNDEAETEGEKTEGENAGDEKTDGVKTTITVNKTTDNVKHMPVVIVKDHVAKQEHDASTKTTDWRTSAEAKRRFADIAYQHQGFKDGFSAAWRAEVEKHGSKMTDGITGLGLPVDGKQIVIDALEKSEGLISHFDFIGGKTYLVKLLTVDDSNAESARAGGHKKGDTKLFQELKSTPRQFYNVPVYKKLDIDYLELYENPELVDVRARELVEARIIEIERAMSIGDGRTAPSEGQPDRRMFRGGRGFYSIVADAADTNGIGSLFATEVEAPKGSNLYEASILAEAALRAEGKRVMIAKKDLVTNFRLARLDDGTGDYILKPGASIEAALGVDAIYTPAWMDNADCDFITFVSKTPKMIGQAPASPDMKAFFDTTNDTDVLMAEGPNGGGLAAYKAAAVVTIATE